MKEYQYVTEPLNFIFLEWNKITKYAYVTKSKIITDIDLSLKFFFCSESLTLDLTSSSYIT